MASNNQIARLKVYWLLMIEWPIFISSVVFSFLLIAPSGSGWKLMDFGMICLIAPSLGLAMSVLVVGTKWGRHRLVSYLKFMCKSPGFNTLTQEVAAANPETFQYSGIAGFERLLSAFEIVRRGFLSGVFQAIVFVIIFFFPFLFFHTPETQNFICEKLRCLTQVQTLELSSVVGTLMVVGCSFLTLPEQRFTFTKLLFFVLLLVIVCLFFAGAALFVGGEESADLFNNTVLHAVGVVGAGVGLFLFDVLALVGLKLGKGDHRVELLQMCVVIDVPVVLASGAAAFFCLSRWDELGTAAEPLLGGALGMQFVLSALSFAIVKQQIVNRIGSPAT